MMPQYADKALLRTDWSNIYQGLFFFSIGLAKKTLLADTLAPLVSYCADTASSLSFLEASLGSLAYTLQLYFDFSGYTDMAIGCALFFNIRLPQNFSSPYKSRNIQVFWRRWHITLSRWLSEYIYVPLGGNRKGTPRTLINLCITFLVGGLWHGAAWTFVLWGALHGLASAVHRLWSRYIKTAMPKPLGIALTFAFVNFAWVVFRAPSMARLQVYAKAFSGEHGFGIRKMFKDAVNGIYFGSIRLSTLQIIIGIMLAAVFLAKNSSEMDISRPTKKTSVFIAALLLGSILKLTMPNAASEFIYFQF